MIQLISLTQFKYFIKKLKNEFELHKLVSADETIIKYSKPCSTDIWVQYDSILQNLI